MTEQKCTYRLFFLFLIILGLCPIAKSQCEVDSLFGEQIRILNETTLAVRMNVRNAAIDTIGDLNQGVCGVKLNFNHTNLGDLRIILVAPNGAQITLIGPTDKNATIPQLPLFPIEHDLTFRLNFSPGELPDPGFPQQWSNNITSIWGQPGFPDPYTGFYLPFAGDLVTDLSGGHINGTWELIVEDAFINDVGLLRSFELEFCEPQGIECSTCESRSGTFSQRVVEICDSEILDFTDYYISDNYDSLYSDLFVTYTGENFQCANDTLLDVSILPVGKHTIYGLNVLIDDLDSLGSLLPLLTQTELLDLVDRSGGFFCIDRSDSLVINVNSPGAPIVIAESLCTEEFRILFGDTLRSPGVHIRTNSTCDSTVELTLSISDLTIADPQGIYYIDCLSDSIDLQVSYNSSTGVKIDWLNNSGAFVGSDSIIRVGFAGMYQVILDDMICADTLEFDVLDPRDTMSLTIISDISELNCRDSSVSLTNIANFPITIYTWSSGIDTLSSDNQFITTIPGTYELVARDINGCEISDTDTITEDFVEPQLEIQLDSFNCGTEQVTIQINTFDNLNLEWLDAALNQVSTDPIFLTSFAGDFTLIATNDNFCDTTILFNIPIDTTPVSILNVPESGILNCDVDRYEIDANIMGSGILSGFWTNNGQIVEIGEHISITVSGAYEFVAISDNQCSDTGLVNIAIDTIHPIVMLTGDELTCTVPQVVIGAQAMGDNLLFDWSDLVDTVLTPSTAAVSAPGIYAVGVIDTINECVTIDTILINQDEGLPGIQLEGDSILTCLNPQLMIRDISSETASGEWYSPTNDTIIGKQIVVDQPGIYRYKGIGSNGCSAFRNITIQIDTLVPQIDIPLQVFLNCNSPSVTINLDQDPTINLIKWDQGGTVTEGNQYVVGIAQDVTIFVMGVNGCSDLRSIEVDSDLSLPDIQLIGDELNCNNPNINIETSVTNDRYAYNWSGNVIDGQGSPSILLSSTGFYALEVTDTISGCVNIDSIFIAEDFVSPTFDSIIITRFLRCDFETGRIRVVANADVQINFTNPDGVVSTSDEIQVTQGGDYIIELVGANGCTEDRLETIIDTRGPVDFHIDSEYTLTCLEPSTILEPSQIGSNVDYIWIYDNGDTIRSQQQVIVNATLASVYAIDTTGCDTLIPINIDLDTLAPVSNILSDDVLSCNGLPIELSSSEDDIVEYAFRWSGDAISPIIDLPQIDVSNSGSYYLLVVNRSNGCQMSDTIQVNISSSPIAGIEFDLSDESCIGANDGEIIISNVLGGEGVVMASIDDMDIPSLELDQLSPGDYNVFIIDGLGCDFDTTITIVDGADYVIDLGADLEVNRGNDVIIRPDYFGGLPVITDYSNFTGDIGSSIDSLFISPTSDQTIIAISESENGCISFDTLNIEVLTDLSQVVLYVPNVMALNSTEGNNILTLQLTDDILSVTNFFIYDRWGKVVFFIEDFNGVEITPVWDGTFNGRELASGVYVYSYEILINLDNRSKIVSGDITILR